MSGETPIPSQARPYAAAVFALAREKNAVPEWNGILRAAAAAAGSVFSGIAGRALVPQSKLAEAILELAGAELQSPEARNFIRVLAENRRLELTGAVADLYEEYRRDAEGIERAWVETARPIGDDEKAALVAALQKRVGRKIRAEYRENPDLLAGARIRIRDNVLDASARGRLARLAASINE